MRFQSLFYSLKVWLASAVTTPMIYGILQLYLTPNRFYLSSIEDYPFLVVLELAFSFFTWLTFWMIIRLVMSLVSNDMERKCLISFIGALLTIGTFKVFSLADMTYSLTNFSFVLMAGNALCIAIGSWLFYPTTKIYSPQDFPS